MSKRTTDKRRVVIGIDSSTSCTGYAVLAIDDEKSNELIDYGKIIPGVKLGYLDKCKFIIDGIDQVAHKYKDRIDSIAIEQPNSSVNMNTTRILCGLYGMIRYILFVNYGTIPVEINTRTLKLAISGNGSASKLEIVSAVNKRFRKKFVHKDTSNKKKTDDDICDAIGAAVAWEKNR